MTGARWRLTGRITVGLPPDEAFRLFTPRGEQDWAHGWEPSFPNPAEDDTQPGVVFETDAHGQRTVWLVLDRAWGRHISYARVTPRDRAGTVSVVLTEAGGHSDTGGHSEVEVTYELTALTGAAEEPLRAFAERYPAYLRSWQDDIAAYLSRAAPRWPATS